LIKLEQVDFFIDWVTSYGVRDVLISGIHVSAMSRHSFNPASPQLVEDPAGFFGAEEWGPGLGLEFIPLIQHRGQECT